jgi:hypothetical protein
MYKGSHSRMKGITQTLVVNLRTYFAKNVKKRTFLALLDHCKKNKKGSNETQQNYTAMKDKIRDKKEARTKLFMKWQVFTTEKMLVKS